jgi:hypothetical protein
VEHIASSHVIPHPEKKDAVTGKLGVGGYLILVKSKILGKFPPSVVYDIPIDTVTRVQRLILIPRQATYSLTLGGLQGELVTMVEMLAVVATSVTMFLAAAVIAYTPLFLHKGEALLGQYMKETEDS